MSDIFQAEQPQSSPRIGPEPRTSLSGANESPRASMASFNAFSLLGLAQSFDVCLVTLNQRYEQAQGLVHPDQWRSETAKALAAQHSVRCNQAYTLLKSPETRAAHMLQLGGHWPVPDFPDLFEILMDWHDHGHHPQAPELITACHTFSNAIHTGNIVEAQRAYWWIKVISNRNKNVQ